jgi:hypothetical protein
MRCTTINCNEELKYPLFLKGDFKRQNPYCRKCYEEIRGLDPHISEEKYGGRILGGGL